jgi:hypothetical protein
LVDTGEKMELGWIDFSKNERDKVFDVLNSLSEQGTLDELGIAPIRDGFSDIFFPGTSTLQTRAKYFLLVPYACKDLEHSDIKKPKAAYDQLYKIEQNISASLLKSCPNETGIIGSSQLNIDKWVKRPPSALYWAGLRRYGIFNGDYSLNEYLKAICALKAEKSSIKQLGNRNDNADADDKDAGDIQGIHFFSLQAYTPNWKDNLTIQLTTEEANYLKGKIISSCPNSLIAYILKNKLTSILSCDNFEAVIGCIQDDKIIADCKMAVAFGRFTYVLYVIYNILTSNGENEKANLALKELQPNFGIIANLNIEAIYDRLNLSNDKLANRNLKNFLLSSQSAMRSGDVEKLKILVKEREKRLKGENRAKTFHAGTFDKDAWFGVDSKLLDYRFSQARQIIKDIFEGEGNV